MPSVRGAIPDRLARIRPRTEAKATKGRARRDRPGNSIRAGRNDDTAVGIAHAPMLARPGLAGGDTARCVMKCHEMSCSVMRCHEVPCSPGLDRPPCLDTRHGDKGPGFHGSAPYPRPPPVAAFYQRSRLGTDGTMPGFR